MNGAVRAFGPEIAVLGLPEGIVAQLAPPKGHVYQFWASPWAFPPSRGLLEGMLAHFGPPRGPLGRPGDPEVAEEYVGRLDAVRVRLID